MEEPYRRAGDGPGGGPRSGGVQLDQLVVDDHDVGVRVGRARARSRQSAFSDHTGVDLELGPGGQRLDALARPLQGRPGRHPGLLRLRQLDRRGERPQARAQRRRRRLHRGRQQAGHRERPPERLRPGRRLLPRGQLRRSGAGPEPRVPRRLPGARRRHQQAAQRVQPDPPGRRLGLGADGLLLQQVQVRRRPRRGLPGRLALGHPDVGRARSTSPSRPASSSCPSRPTPRPRPTSPSR